MAGLTAEEFQLLREAVDERRCRDGTDAWRDSFIAANVPKWRRRCCGRRFTSPRGTVLEHCRTPLPAWVSSIRLMRPIVPVECAAELCGVSHKTDFEWRRRTLATVTGYQDRFVLCDTF